MKFELKVISAIEILHSDQLKYDYPKPLISRHFHVSDSNFPKQAGAIFSPEAGGLQMTTEIQYQKVFCDY